MNKKIILGIIIGLILGSVSVYAGTKMYASDVSINTPTGSNLGSDATLQNSLDELYSIADKYDELNTEINSLKNNTLTLDKMYPVGSIYISTDITTASDISKKFGGTWETYGSGRTLVGVDTSDTDFNVSSKIGGNKIHKHVSPLATYYYNGSWYIGRTSFFGSTSSTIYGVWGATQSIANENISSTTSRELFYTSESSNLQPYITVYMYKRVK